MSKLFIRSKSRLASAQRDLLAVADDDGALDGACFQLQQSLEFAIKAFFEFNGLRPPWGHDIKKLLDEAGSSGILINELRAFTSDANMYTNWETETRYNDSFLTTVKDAEICVNRLKALHVAMENIAAIQSEVTPEIYEWCYQNASTVVRELPKQEMLDMMLPLYYKYHKS